MDFEWDEEKRRTNLAKHGLDFADAAMMDWSRATIFEDVRTDYGEQRYWAFGMWDGRMYLAAYAIRHGNVRIISFRKANRKEVAKYGKT